MFCTVLHLEDYTLQHGLMSHVRRFMQVQIEQGNCGSVRVSTETLFIYVFCYYYRGSS